MSATGLDVDLDQIAEICRRYGVARLDVFGSVGAVTIGPPATSMCSTSCHRALGWDIETLADELCAALGRRVDLVSRKALHQRLRDAVPAEARLLYAA